MSTMPRARASSVTLALGALLALSAMPASGQIQCDRCHDELEFLRQHVPTLADARDLFVPTRVLEASAHGDLECSVCHGGVSRYPHSTEPTTATCRSCHEEAEAVWRRGLHAPDDNASCASCHGIHDVLTVEALGTPAGIDAMQRACADCHFEPALPSSDPHADSVSCAGCHEPHATLPPADPRATIHVLNQPESCGSCHDSTAAVWKDDVHARAVVELTAADAQGLDGATSTTPPGCTSCHGAHGTTPRDAPGFELEMVNRCSACHEDYSDTFYGTYHGKATALGSEIAATCDQCHGSHRILPATEEASAVHPANLVETCGGCHERARASFVAYDSHPNPMDRSRNAPLFYSFIFMNALLFGVLGIFVLHTVLWWIRLLLDQRAGVRHGAGGSS